MQIKNQYLSVSNPQTEQKWKMTKSDMTHMLEFLTSILLLFSQFVTLSAGLLQCLIFSKHFSTFLSHLKGDALFLSKYLHKLFKRDHHKGQRYHEKQISLYAEYDRSNLLPFLRDSTHCPLEKVLLFT